MGRWQTIGALLAATLRATDVAARLGGDEFAILLPEATRAQAALVAERLRTGIRDLGQARRSGVTASIGVACFHAPPRDLATLLREADSAMYSAKQGGKDRVVVVTFDGEVAAQAP